MLTAVWGQVVIDAFDLLSIEVPESLNEHIELLMSIGDNPELSTDTGELKPDVGNAIATVWAFDGAKEAVEMSHEFQRALSSLHAHFSLRRLTLLATLDDSERLGFLVRLKSLSTSSATQVDFPSLSYFDNIARLVQAGYVPSDLDILRSRVKTTGITEIKLDIHGTIYRMMDVGGQRSERKKWINCFQDVQVLLFVLAISGALYRLGRRLAA